MTEKGNTGEGESEDLVPLKDSAWAFVVFSNRHAGGEKKPGVAKKHSCLSCTAHSNLYVYPVVQGSDVYARTHTHAQANTELALVEQSRGKYKYRLRGGGT